MAFTLYKRQANGSRLPITSPGYREAWFHFTFVFRGQRYQRCLETNDHDEAQRRARLLHKRIVAAVTAGRFEEIAGTKTRKPATSTLAELLAIYQRRARVKPRTIIGNVSALRTIIRLGTGHTDLTNEEIGALPCSSLNRSLIRAYQDKMLSGLDGEARARAATTANSTVRQARSITSRDLVEDGVYEDEGIRLQELAGWRAQRLLPEPKHCYTPIPKGLIERIWSESGNLRQSDPQAYVAFLLSICCGLRRSEAANLQWRHIIDADGRHIIRLGVSKNGHPRLIPLDPAVWEALRLVADHDQAKPDDYLLTGSSTRRWRVTFDALGEWLRGLGWDRTKKAHELRKHYGSLVATQHGTRTAAMLLGNTEPVMRAHYDALLDLPASPLPFGLHRPRTDAKAADPCGEG